MIDPTDLRLFPTVADLHAHLAAVQAEILRRQEEARQRLLDQARAVAQEHGVSLDAFLRRPAKKRPVSKPASKTTTHPPRGSEAGHQNGAAR